MSPVPGRFGRGDFVVADIDEAMARTLYETDEDITDEAIANLAARGDFSWQEVKNPRLSWDEASPSLRSAYRRRARAAIALLQSAGYLSD